MNFLRLLLAVRRPIMILFLAIVATVYIHPVFIVGVVIMVCDTLARARDYLSFQGIYYRMTHVLKFKKSWCSRGVAMALWPEAKRDYELLGYKWYHIFPDGAPKVFLDVSFWKSVLGWDKKWIR